MRFIVLIFLLLPLTTFAQKDTAKGTIKIVKSPGTRDTAVSFVVPPRYTNVFRANKSKNYNHDTIRPQYIGGEEAMKKFIYSNLKYPENSRYKGISAECDLIFTVNPDKSTTNIVVTHGVAGCKECDEESIRIVKLMTDWTSAIYKPTGQNVSARTSVSVHFTYLK